MGTGLGTGIGTRHKLELDIIRGMVRRYGGKLKHLLSAEPVVNEIGTFKLSSVTAERFKQTNTVPLFSFTVTFLVIKFTSISTRRKSNGKSIRCWGQAQGCYRSTLQCRIQLNKL